MSQVNIINGTIEIAPGEVLSANFEIDGTATLNLSGGRTIVTTENGPELLEDMRLISTIQADSLDNIIAESKSNGGPRIALIFKE